MKLSNRVYQESSIEKIDTFKKEIIQARNAIESKHVIHCDYNNKFRTVYPLKVLNLEGYWYLIIFEPKDEKIKTFHLNSVKNIEILDEVYKFDKDIIDGFDNAITAYYKPENEPITIELYLGEKVARYFHRKPLSKSQRTIREYDDGACEIEITVSSFMEIIPTIQRYLPHVKVISPKELQQEIVANISSYLEG